MPTMGEKLWQVAKSPPQNLAFLVFGLFALLAGFLLRSWSLYAGTALTTPALFAAAALGGVGAFFVAASLFLGAFAGLGDSDHVAVRIAALLGGLVVLIFLL